MIFLNYFIPLISFILSVISVPFIIKYGTIFNYIDYPNVRKQHTAPLVRIGGLSIFFSILIPILFCISTTKNLNFENKEFIVILFSSFLIFILGFIEDRSTLSFNIRLSIQFLIAIFTWYFGFQIRLEPLLEIIKINPNLEIFNFLSLMVTTFFIVGTTNAINWLDGLDGLSSQISLVVLASFLALVLPFSSEVLVIWLCLSMIGSILGFLFHNSYPSTILMGDCGSNFIGFTLSLIAIYFSNNLFQENLGTNTLYIYSPLFLLSLPILDMFYVICKRLLKNLSPFKPDRNHLHFRILKFGFSYNNTVTLITFIAALISTIVFKIFDQDLILLFKILFIIFFIKTIFQKKIIKYFLFD